MASRRSARATSHDADCTARARCARACGKLGQPLRRGSARRTHRSPVRALAQLELELDVVGERLAIIGRMKREHERIVDALSSSHSSHARPAVAGVVGSGSSRSSSRWSSSSTAAREKAARLMFTSRRRQPLGAHGATATRRRPKRPPPPERHRRTGHHRSACGPASRRHRSYGRS